MDFGCLLVAGGICVLDFEEARKSRFGVVPFTIKVDTPAGWGVIAPFSDNLIVPDRSRLDHVCDGDWCVSYHRRCESRSTGEVRCEFSYVRPGDEFYQRFTFEAAIASALPALAANFVVVPHDGKDGIGVSFEMMAVEADTERLPMCRSERNGSHRCF